MRWATYSSVQCASSDRGQGPNILGFCTSDLESSRLRERISASPLGYKRFARHSRRQGQRRARQLDQPTPQLPRSEEHTSELQSLMRISYAVFCLKKKTT